MFRLSFNSKRIAQHAIPVICALKGVEIFQQNNSSKISSSVASKKYTWNSETKYMVHDTINSPILMSVGKWLHCVALCDDYSTVNTIQYPNGDVYIGETVSGLKHGNGVMYYESGREYSGEWFEDKKHGHGVLKTPEAVLMVHTPVFTTTVTTKSHDISILDKARNSIIRSLVDSHVSTALFAFECMAPDETYSGQFDNDRFHGHGVLTRSSDGAVIYDGEWHSNEPHGAANSFKMMDGGEYQGEFYFGKPDGHGTAALPEGVYTGQLKNGEAEGQGVMTFINGDVYTGEFRNTRMHGLGVMKMHDGTVYDGEWRDSMRHGQGVTTTREGKVFHSGTWDKDRMLGPCVVHLSEETVFTGECGEQGPMKGQFVVTCENGVILTMEMENYTHKVGPTVITLPDGGVYELNPALDASPQFIDKNVYFGTFDKQAKFTGSAILFQENGDIYAGEIRLDQANGYGTKWYADGTVYVGQWSDNKQHGQGV